MPFADAARRHAPARAHHDGFAFGVADELTAFRAAYLYRHCADTKVQHGPSGWRVSVYTTTLSAQPCEPPESPENTHPWPRVVGLRPAMRLFYC
jgi:hypothetical protein